MQQEQLKKIVHAEPFKPYRLSLTGGEQVLVNRPRKSHVSGSVVSLVGEVMREVGASRVERFRIIRVEDVVSAEHVDVPIKGR